MTTNDFKKLLQEAVQPLKQGIDEVRNDLNEVKQDLSSVKQELTEVRHDLSEEISNVKQDQISLRQLIEERVLPPLVYIETTVKGYADMYVTNGDHFQRLDTRLNTVEDKLGIQTPEDLSIPHLN